MRDVKVEVRIPHHRAFNGAGGLPEKHEGAPLLSLESGDLPSGAAGVRVNGEWFVAVDYVERQVLEQVWARAV